MGTAKGVEANWWARNASRLKTVFRLILGLVWTIDGALKFTSGYNGTFLSNVQASEANAPSWLHGWYSFWVARATNHTSLIVYTVGTLEILLGIALLLGLLRKTAYLAGMVLSLLIWAVPEGFGAPYGPGSGATDIGTGAIYALAFLDLIVINSTYGPSRWSVDHLIEKIAPRWASIAEFGGIRALRGPAPGTSPPPT